MATVAWVPALHTDENAGAMRGERSKCNWVQWSARYWQRLLEFLEELKRITCANDKNSSRAGDNNCQTTCPATVIQWRQATANIRAARRLAYGALGGVVWH